LIDIPLSRPDIGPEEIAAVTEVLRSPHLSLGPKLGQFEAALGRFCNSPHVIATSSGTAALHLCLRALSLPQGSEVITTPFSFIASANVLLFERLKPVFVDIDPETLNMDPTRIEAAIGPKTKAILVVHAFGNPAPMPAIMAIAQRFELAVIEDACEAIGSTIEGRHVGTWGDLGTLAFYPNKQMTTGEGGAILTHRPEFSERLRILRNQGRKPSGQWLDMEELGYNYRLSDIQCALGIAQVSRLKNILAKRCEVASRYDTILASFEEVQRPPRPDLAESMGWFVYVIRLADRFSRSDRDRIVSAMGEAGIACGRYFAPIHLQPYYRRHFGFQEGCFPLTEAAANRAIALPFFNKLSDDQAQRVGEELRRSIDTVSG